MPLYIPDSDDTPECSKVYSVELQQKLAKDLARQAQFGFEFIDPNARLGQQLCIIIHHI